MCSWVMAMVYNGVRQLLKAKGVLMHENIIPPPADGTWDVRRIAVKLLMPVMLRLVEDFSFKEPNGALLTSEDRKQPMVC